MPGKVVPTTYVPAGTPSKRARFIALIRRSAPGMKYAVLVTLALMIGWDLEGFPADVMDAGWTVASVGAAKFMWYMALHQLPMPINASTISVS